MAEQTCTQCDGKGNELYPGTTIKTGKKCTYCGGSGKVKK